MSASINFLGQSNRTSCEQPGHDHQWPTTGLLVIERCEHYCLFCTGPRAAKRWSSAWFLRRHIKTAHVPREFPHLTVSDGWQRRPQGNSRPANRRRPPPGSNRKRGGTAQQRRSSPQQQFLPFLPQLPAGQQPVPQVVDQSQYLSGLGLDLLTHFDFNPDPANASITHTQCGTQFQQLSLLDNTLFNFDIAEPVAAGPDFKTPIDYNMYDTQPVSSTHAHGSTDTIDTYASETSVDDKMTEALNDFLGKSTQPAAPTSTDALDAYVSEATNNFDIDVDLNNNFNEALNFSDFTNDTDFELAMSQGPLDFDTINPLLTYIDTASSDLELPSSVMQSYDY